MKTTLLIGIALAILLSGGDALAGLDFAKSFAVGPNTDAEAIVTINATGGTYDPVGTVDFSEDGTLPFVNAVLDASWAPGTADANSSDASGDLIIWFGPISLNGGLLRLTAVSVSEDGSTFVEETFSDSIAETWANTPYRINLDDLVIPPTDRDQMVAARFIFTYSSGVEFTIDGVSTPEPTTFALFGLGLVGIGGAAVRRRRRKSRKS